MGKLMDDLANYLDQTDLGQATQRSATGDKPPLKGRVMLDMNRWLIDRPIAHRGLHGAGRPENSLSAFHAAINAGHPIELDVRALKDGNIVVTHDRKLQRLTGDLRAIRDLDTAALRRLRNLGTEEIIPTLDDVLDLVRGRTPLLIEIKGESLRPGILEAGVAQRLRRYEGPVAVQSFSPVSVAATQRLMPGIMCGQLLGSLSGIVGMPRWTKAVVRHLSWTFLCDTDFFACDLASLTDKKASRLRASGMPLLAWTVRSRAEAESACRYADNYIFEQPSDL